MFPESLARLIAELSKLPGVGPKSAQRMAFYLLEQDPKFAEVLARTIDEARRTIHPCPYCFNVTDTTVCAICASPERDRTLILVVEEPKDVYALERTREYRGLYHVLGGAIAPIKGIGPEMLRIQELLRRIEHEPVQEVILATDPDVDGETTALYLARLLKDKVKVTRIARGLPIGGDLDYADEMTLVRALEGRREY